jgi:hypothetical protein
MFVERSSTMLVELHDGRPGDLMSTQAQPAPTDTAVSQELATGPATAPVAERLPFKRLVVFESLGEAVGCTASA